MVFFTIEGFSLLLHWSWYPVDVIVFLFHCLGDGWHLRKTNWCGEEAEILEDEVRRRCLREM